MFSFNLNINPLKIFTMETKKLYVASSICATVLAAVVIVLTVLNIQAVFDGSYQTVWTAWWRNWVASVAAVTCMFAITTSAQRRWLRIKLVGMAGVLGMVAFAFFGLAMVVFSFKEGAFARGILQAWVTFIATFVIFLVTAYLNRTQAEQSEPNA